jgi:hypothetical protein
MTGPTDDPPRPADLPAGHDERDPYAEVDLSTYPDWWRENVETFAAAGLRPYRPSRLADDTLTHDLIDRLERQFDADIRLRAVDPQSDGDWALWVDGEPVRRVEHVREPEGFTRYLIDPDQIREAVAGALEER